VAHLVLFGEQDASATSERGKADAALARFQENLDSLERGRIELPSGVDIGTFLLSNGKLNVRPVAPPPARPLTLGKLCNECFSAHSNGAMEANSLATARLHLRQLKRTFGESAVVESLDSRRSALVSNWDLGNRKSGLEPGACRISR
jgi:hypothetical protein